MIFHLRELYGEGPCNRSFNVVSELLRTKMVKGAPVYQHGLKMIGLIEQLESLDSPLDASLANDIFLTSLLDSFSKFDKNYNMGKMELTLAELLNMCVTIEKTFKKEEGNGTIVFLRRDQLLMLSLIGKVK